MAKEYKRVGDVVYIDGVEAAKLIDGEVVFDVLIKNAMQKRKLAKMLQGDSEPPKKDNRPEKADSVEDSAIQDEKPKGDPKMGDKDPAVMAWYKRHKPALYASKYEKYLKKLGEVAGKDK